MKKLLPSLLGIAMCIGVVSAQVGINTNTPQTTLDVNGSIQLRDELRINNDPGTAGQVYFSQGGTNTNNDWKNVSVSFLEDGQYQLVNTFAKRDQLGIDWTGTTSNTVIFSESFETGAAGWTQIQELGTASWTFGAGAGAGTITTAQSGSVNARFVAGAGTNTLRTKLVSPRLNFSSFTSNVTMGFWYGQQANTNNNSLRVYYRTSTDGTTWGAWTLISTYTAAANTWTQVSNLILTGSANQSYYQVAFEATGNGSGASAGRPNVLDNIIINSTAATNSYNSALSTTGELFNATNRFWTVIPGLDLPVTIKNGDNRVSLTFQTGVESRLDPGNNTSAQAAGYIRYMCGLFRRTAGQPISSASLVAMRANQIDNFTQKTNENKSQSIFTLNYVVEDIPAGSYVFSTACRRLARSGAGTDATSLFSIGNAVNTGTTTTSDFMMNSVIKMDIIELVTYQN